MKLRALSFFSGVGAWETSLNNLGIEVELLGYSEIDKYASKAFAMMHGVSEDLNLGDITKIDETTLPKDVDIITYSPPCQTFSLAGLRKGTEDPRGVLFFDALRIIEHCKPKYAIMENVKNLTGKQFSTTFNDMLISLENAGYRNYWKVLNAVDYGIPQNRERVFIVSIRKDLDDGYSFPKPKKLEKRLKDVLCSEVPDKYYLKQSMVEFFIQNSLKMERNGNGFRFSPANPSYADVAHTITTRAGGRMDDNFVLEQDLSEDGNYCFNSESTIDLMETNKIIQVGNLVDTGSCNWDNPQRGRVYSPEGVCPALNTCSGGGLEPKIVEKELFMAASRGRNPENPNDRTVGVRKEQRLEINKQGVANTLTTVQKDNYVVELYNPYNNKELTDVAPTLTTGCRNTTSSSSVVVAEIYQRPHGYNDGGIKGEIAPAITTSGYEHNNLVLEGQTIIDDTQTGFNGVRMYDDHAPTLRAERFGLKVTDGIRVRKLMPIECFRLMGFSDEQFSRLHDLSDSQLYKIAGNSIVVDVLMAIFQNLFFPSGVIVERDLF